MAVKKYYSVDGVIIGERDADGTRRNYMHDALGSVVGTTVNGAIENTYAFKPHGGLLAKTGAGPDPAFGWVGTHGYRQTDRAYASVYVRARTYATETARWTTQDPLWPGEPAYAYGEANSASKVDPTGLKPCPSQGLASACIGAVCSGYYTFQWIQTFEETHKLLFNPTKRRLMEFIKSQLKDYLLSFEFLDKPDECISDACRDKPRTIGGVVVRSFCHWFTSTPKEGQWSAANCQRLFHGEDNSDQCEHCCDLAQAARNLTDTEVAKCKEYCHVGDVAALRRGGNK